MFAIPRINALYSDFSPSRSLALSATDRLFAFVQDRLSESHQIAARSHQETATTFTKWGLDELKHLRQELGDGTRSEDEVSGYLRRMAAAYRDHPDFDADWVRS